MAQSTHLTLPITGMTCVNCAANLERAVKKIPGVSEVNVNFATERAADRIGGSPIFPP